MKPDWSTLAESELVKTCVITAAIFVLGCVFWFKAEWIGENFVGHFTSRGQITAPTPAWMLKSFALLMFFGVIAGGFRIYHLLAPHGG
jgi:hypothetical protein